MPSELLRTTNNRAAHLVFVTVLATVLTRPGEVDAQWVEAPGKGWISVEVYHQDTRDRYDQDGRRGAIPFDGHANSTALFVTAAVGLISNWDLWARGSVTSLSFSDISGDRSEEGLGDANVWLRVAPLKYLGVDFPFAIRGGVKIPLGEAPIDAEIIPLGEGQTDWEIMVEIGHSFWPRSAYVNGWVGYRYRGPNEEAAKDPGEEIFFLAQVGGVVGRFQYKLVTEGWNGDTPVREGIPVPTSQRHYLQVTPSLWYQTALGGFELGWRVPLDGRNLPAGGALVVGYFSRLGV